MSKYDLARERQRKRKKENFLSDFPRKAGEPVSPGKHRRKLPSRCAPGWKLPGDLSLTTAVTLPAIRRSLKYTSVYLFRVRYSVTVRRVDTHLRNWPNATTIMCYACGLPGRGARTWHVITWPTYLADRNRASLLLRSIQSKLASRRSEMKRLNQHLFFSLSLSFLALSINFSKYHWTEYNFILRKNLFLYTEKHIQMNQLDSCLSMNKQIF